MQTIYDVLYYLNKIDFTDNIDDPDFENLICVTSILVKEFEDYIISELIDVLSIVDNSLITLTVGKLQEILIKTDSLRDFILHLISLKFFVKRNVESD